MPSFTALPEIEGFFAPSIFGLVSVFNHFGVMPETTAKDQ
jgi:hypothetical protein